MEAVLPAPGIEPAPISVAVPRRDAAIGAGEPPATEAGHFTLAQRVARHGLAVAAVVLASALFASQIHATLR